MSVIILSILVLAMLAVIRIAYAWLGMRHPEHQDFLIKLMASTKMDLPSHFTLNVQRGEKKEDQDDDKSK